MRFPFGALLLTTVTTAAHITITHPVSAQVAGAALGVISIARKEARPDNLLNLISRKDCLNQDYVRFNLSLTGSTLNNYQLEAWVGPACDGKAQRGKAGTATTCTLVYGPVKAQQNPPAVELAVSSLLKQYNVTDSCEVQSTVDGPLPVNVYWLLVDPSTFDAAVVSNYTKLNYDLRGPQPPASVRAGIGEDSLVVSFDTAVSAQSPDLAGYEFFCDLNNGVDDPGSDPNGGAAGAAGNTAGGNAGGNSGAGGTSNSGAGGNTGTYAGQGGGGTTSLPYARANRNSANRACGSSLLRSGQLPPSGAQSCGRINSKNADRGTAKNLTNGIEYAVYVAAFDASGNMGILSKPACGTPEDLAGFFDKYRDAGGTAGGGLCSMHSTSAPGLLGFLSVVGFVAWWRKRQDQSC